MDEAGNRGPAMAPQELSQLPGRSCRTRSAVVPTGIRLAASLVLILGTGCTSWRDYVQKGFKVGPDYCRPAAAVAEHWIDAADVRETSGPPHLWWTVFNDPVLNDLVTQVSRQNLSLRQAGFRILQARSQRDIVRGNVFPQQQDVAGSYRHFGTSGEFFDQWNWGFTLAWELDFWGRFRRAVHAADATLDASIENYDDVLVTLLADAANNYVLIRSNQERLRLLEKTFAIQEAILTVGEAQLKVGHEKTTTIDVEQIRSNLLQNKAQIEQLLINIRLAANRLCTLMGIPPQDLERQLGTAKIPVAPPEAAVGIPADLLRRRPDVRRAERLAAAQAEQIGMAQADLYPAITINGTLGYQAQEFADLFSSRAFNGSIGPSFRWNVLNYGRLVNNVRLQDARLQEAIALYQDTVLSANAEVEQGLVTFLRAQKRAKLLNASVLAAQMAVKTIEQQRRAGTINFNQYAVIQQNLIQQQDLWAQSLGEVAAGLIQVYRALGGGWEIRLQQDGVPGPATRLEENPPAPAPPE